MTGHRHRYGPDHPEATYVAHGFAERLVDLGEVQLNHAVAGDGVDGLCEALRSNGLRLFPTHARPGRTPRWTT